MKIPFSPNVTSLRSSSFPTQVNIYSAFFAASSGEGEDSFHTKRRGYQYFLDHTVLPHNNSFGKKVLIGSQKYQANREVKFSTNESEIMKLQIPLSEINTNELIN